MADFRLAQHVSWAVETGGVRIFDGAAGAAVFLSYPQAAIWDLTVRGEAPDRIVEKLRWIAAVSAEESRTLVMGCLADWLCRHYLVEEAADG